MYRKTISLLLVLACLALATACGKKDDQINTFIADLTSFTDELVKKPNVDEAQKYMDSRKEEMKGKFDSIKNIGENQISEETKKKLQESVVDNAKKVSQMVVKYGSDPAASPKLQKLMQDYQGLFKM